MSKNLIYLLLAFIAGAMMPVQAVTNNKMATVSGSPILAALISFCVGTVALFVYLIASGASLSKIASAKDAPAIAWIGGLLGAFFVTATLLLAPRLGVAVTFTLVIAGQMLASIIIDHYGLLGVPVQQISVAKLAGILLVTVGVVLIRRF